jgi:hypothetical protein
MKNTSDTEIRGRLAVASPSGLKFANPEMDYDLPARKTRVFNFNPAGKSMIPTEKQIEIVVTAAHESGTALVNRIITLYPCARMTGEINIDGNLDEWKSPESILLSGDALNPPDVQVHLWKGTKDLSAEIHTAWDVNRFYLAARVTDDVFVQSNSGDDAGRGDSLMTVFNVLNDAVFADIPVRGGNYYEYRFALTEKGPQSYGYTAQDGSIKIAVKKFDGYVNYELAIPGKSLAPLKLAQGTVFGFNAVVNEDDGIGRRWCLQLAPSIPGKRDSAAFKHWVLMEKP